MLGLLSSVFRWLLKALSGSLRFTPRGARGAAGGLPSTAAPVRDTSCRGDTSSGDIPVGPGGFTLHKPMADASFCFESVASQAPSLIFLSEHKSDRSFAGGLLDCGASLRG